MRNGPFDETILVTLAICFILQRFFGRRRSLAISGSFFTDYGYLALNKIALGSLVALAYQGIRTSYASWVPITNLRPLEGQPFAVQALVGFLVYDFMMYVSHWIRHKVGPLWHLHAIHHSMPELNPAAQFRNHPFDIVASTIICYLPVTMLGGDTWAGAFVATIETFWPSFVHSDLPIALGPLKYILVTPSFHRIHHSIEARHWDKNLGEFLVVWDWLFGTACFDFEDSFELGVRGFPVQPEPRVTVKGIVGSWCRLMWYPVQTFAVNLFEGHPLRRLPAGSFELSDVVAYEGSRNEAISSRPPESMMSGRRTRPE